MWLQQALRPAYTGRIDGVLGMGTLAALKADKNNDALIDRICSARMAFLKHLSTFGTFGRGWTARVAEVRAIGQAWATGQVPQAANFVDGGQAKAFVDDANAAPSTAPADLATGAGTGGLGLSGYLYDLAEPAVAAVLHQRVDRQGGRGRGTRKRGAGDRRARLSLVRQSQGQASRRGAWNGAGVTWLIPFVAGVVGVPRPVAVIIAWTAIAVAISGAVFAGYEFIKDKGADEVRAKIEKGNQDAIRKGIDARMSLDECIDAGGVYDFRRQRCTSATLGPR